MLIDASYFVGELNIPNTDKVDVGENLSWLIEKYEPVFLEKLMGAFSSVFLDGISDEDAAEQRFKDILYGKGFTNGSNYKRWWGLKSKDSPPLTLYKQSVIASYVYWFCMDKEISLSSGVGEVKANAENATPITPQAKMARAWNELYEQVQIFFDFMEENKASYPEWNADHKSSALLYFYRVNLFGI